jgi:hypothetical protein
VGDEFLVTVSLVDAAAFLKLILKAYFFDSVLPLGGE